MLVQKDATGLNFVVALSSRERGDLMGLGVRNGMMSDEVVAMAIEVGMTYMMCVERQGASNDEMRALVAGLREQVFGEEQVAA